ncbi:MAG: glycosyltransferase family 4 protein [Chloroflexi bacterium]|nr:glycosyltransferase family 4 protein [Chloroflexota bacterium]
MNAAIKSLLRPLSRPVRRVIDRARLARQAQNIAGELDRARRAPRPAGEPMRVSYAHAGFPHAVPGPEAVVSGGAVKYQYLHRCLPHAGWQCDVLYAVSSSHYADLAALLPATRARGIKMVWNQNGAYIPFFYGVERARAGNAAMAPLLHRADYVLYQSAFARLEADHFLGKRQGPSEILYNAVDTTIFSPGDAVSREDLVLLAAGSHDHRNRLPTAVQTLAAIGRRRVRARLIVAGRVAPSMMAEVAGLASRLGVEDRVEFTGPYTQQMAPAVFRRAHILLHTQYYDVCPTVVIEAMACGLPVVCSKTGGTAELIDDESGAGVPAELDWIWDIPPDPAELAECVLTVADALPRYSQAARERAVERFDLRRWLDRHVQVFEMLTERSS